MIIVVALADIASTEVAIIDFSTEPPTSTMISPPGYGIAAVSGYVVDCYGTILVIGSYENSGWVYVYSIGDPGNPNLCGQFDTGLSGVAAISTDGTYVLAGGPDGSFVLANIADAYNPYVVCSSPIKIGGMSSVVIRYPNALVCGFQDGLTIDYSNMPPIMVGLDSFPPNAYNFGGLWSGDFDGTWAAVISVPAPENPAPTGIALFSISNGSPSSPWTMIGAWYSRTSLAIAEEIDGSGCYLAVGMPDSSFSVGLFSNGQEVASSSFLVPESSAFPNIVVLKFLNNPAVAPFLAVANGVYTEPAAVYYVNVNWLQTSGDPSDPTTMSIQDLGPTPTAQVTLSSMENPTLGITCFNPPLPWPFPWWRIKALPWQVLQQLLKNLGQG